MNKTVEFRARKGIRNDVLPERFSSEDLLTGINIDIDETGGVSRRQGTKQLILGSTHSVWAEAGYALLVKDGVLYRLRDDLTLVPIKAVAGNKLAYLLVNDEVFWTDGLESGVISRDAHRAWGIVPPSQISASACGGGLPAGKYLFTLTYVRADGLESGAPQYGQLDLADGQGLGFIDLPVSSDITVTHKNLYVTACNGSVAFHSLALSNSETSASITTPTQSTSTLRTHLMGPALAGTSLGYYNGRVYLSNGSFLTYSLPYELELFEETCYIALGSDVQTIATVADGMFVGTTRETLWLSGSDPSDFSLRQVAPYGTVRGTALSVRGDQVLDGVRGEAAVWMSARGLCLGTERGEMKNLTGGRVLPVQARVGASFAKVCGGSQQVVVSLFGG